MRLNVVVLFVCFFLSSLTIKAQIPYANSREVILKGVDMYEKEEYKRAIEIFHQVHECDTNYALAVYEEVLALVADSQFVAAKQLAKASIGLRYGNKRNAMLQLASCYDYIHQPDSAIALYDTLIKMYPNDHQPWFEKGVVYFTQKDYDKAAYNFQRALVINPNHFRSHYMLGKTYTLQGRLAEALMAEEASMLVTKNADQAKLSIAVISAITEQTDEVKKAYTSRSDKYNNPSYEEIDQIINARLAINQSYKLKIALNDNIFRQSQAMMEKLRFDPSDTSFTMQYYVPFFAEVYKQDMFEGFMLLVFSDFGLPTVDALAKRKKDAIADAKQIVFPIMNKIQSTRVLNYTRRKDAQELYHYLGESDIIIVGEMATVGKESIMKGDVVVYRMDQSLFAAGHYNNEGEKDGPWKYYYKTGVVSKEVTYKKNIAVGTMNEYYGNGCLSKVTITDDKGDPLQEDTYNYKGWKNYSTKKTGERETEESSFTIGGHKEVTAFFTDKKIKDGTYTFTYENGKTDRVVNFKNGNYSGPYKKYYDNGQLSEESVFEDGKVEGMSTSYHNNGKMNKKAMFHAGKYDGAYESYYDNGQLEEIATYKKNKRIGTSKRYSRDGKLYCEIEYDNNVPSSLKYFDATGKAIYEKSEKRGMYEYTTHYANGNKLADIKLDRDGLLDGTITYYYSTGAKSNEITYKNGNKEGTYITYGKSGGVRSEQSYANDVLDGYYKAYFDNGILQSEGWYKEGKKQGLWKYYHTNGKIENEIYFLNDYWNGYNKEYNVNGELMYKYIYDYDMQTAYMVYDSTGKQIDSFVFQKGIGEYHMPNKNGKRFNELEGSIMYGSLHGVITSKYMNGAERRRANYKFGKKEGNSETHFPDGKLDVSATFNNGEQEGKALSYNEVGELVNEEYYTDGLLNGKRNSYACNRLYISYNFRNGDKDGEQIYYGEDGKIACVLYYDDGDVIGYSHEGKDGKLLPMIPVKNGTANIKASYANGARSAEINIDQNRFNGTCRIYYSNGKVAEERNSKMGLLDGVFKRYLPDGKLIYEIVYKDNEESEAEKTYDKTGALLIDKPFYMGSENGVVSVTDPVTRKTKKYTYHYGELINVAE